MVTQSPGQGLSPVNAVVGRRGQAPDPLRPRRGELLHRRPPPDGQRRAQERLQGRDLPLRERRAQGALRRLPREVHPAVRRLLRQRHRLRHPLGRRRRHLAHHRRQALHLRRRGLARRVPARPGEEPGAGRQVLERGGRTARTPSGSARSGWSSACRTTRAARNSRTRSRARGRRRSHAVRPSAAACGRRPRQSDGAEASQRSWRSARCRMPSRDHHRLHLVSRHGGDELHRLALRVPRRHQAVERGLGLGRVSRLELVHDDFHEGVLDGLVVHAPVSPRS